MWIGTNAYTWHLVSQAQGIKLEDNLPAVLDQVAASGLEGYEPGVDSPEQLEQLVGLCTGRGLTMKSIYVGGTFHEADEIKQTTANILAIADVCQAHDISVIVTNPDPINWDTEENKNDTQLRTEVSAFEDIGGRLADMGIALAFHFHTPEFRASGREVHAVMALTDPQSVKLCLDTHWAYRGAGDSQVALESLIALYGDRIASLHLRQSHDGIWADGFGPGDIDYEAIVPLIKAKAPAALPVLEICWEEGSVREADPVELHRAGAAYFTRLWENT